MVFVCVTMCRCVCTYIKHVCMYICFKRIYFIDFFLKFWQMNNLKKILQQVLDYYNEVGCIRLLKILFIFCITSPVFVVS